MKYFVEFGQDCEVVDTAKELGEVIERLLAETPELEVRVTLKMFD